MQIEWEDTKNKYEGFFSENQKNGFGIYTWKDGSFFEGNWENDKRYLFYFVFFLHYFLIFSSFFFFFTLFSGVAKEKQCGQME